MQTYFANSHDMKPAKVLIFRVSVKPGTSPEHPGTPWKPAEYLGMPRNTNETPLVSGQIVHEYTKHEDLQR